MDSPVPRGMSPTGRVLLDVLPCLKAWDSSINAMLLVRVSERLRAVGFRPCYKTSIDDANRIG